jgi:hypothetical protein
LQPFFNFLYNIYSLITLLVQILVIFSYQIKHIFFAFFLLTKEFIVIATQYFIIVVENFKYFYLLSDFNKSKLIISNFVIFKNKTPEILEFLFNILYDFFFHIKLIEYFIGSINAALTNLIKLINYCAFES